MPSGGQQRPALLIPSAQRSVPSLSLSFLPLSPNAPSLARRLLPFPPPGEPPPPIRARFARFAVAPTGSALPCPSRPFGVVDFWYFFGFGVAQELAMKGAKSKGAVKADTK